MPRKSKPMKHEYPSGHVVTAAEAMEAWKGHQSSAHCFACETVFRFLAQSQLRGWTHQEGPVMQVEPIVPGAE